MENKECFIPKVNVGATLKQRCILRKKGKLNAQSAQAI